MTCDVCGAKLGLMNKFKYREGYICKECYKKASRQFTETVTQKTLDEIREMCQPAGNAAYDPDFEITARIGNYVLFDEKHYKICVLNNRLSNRQVTNPDFYDASDIRSCQLVSKPRLSKKELEEKMQKKEEGVIEFLCVRLHLKNTDEPVDILLVSTKVRIKSFAFRRAYDFAKRIEEGIVGLCDASKGAQ